MKKLDEFNKTYSLFVFNIISYGHPVKRQNIAKPMCTMFEYENKILSVNVFFVLISIFI